jgi:hypothetical protein
LVPWLVSVSFAENGPLDTQTSPKAVPAMGVFAVEEPVVPMLWPG